MSCLKAVLAAALAIPLATLPAAARDGESSQVVARVRKILAADYVVADRRAPLDAALAQGLATGRYDGVQPEELAKRITADMAAVAHDGHLNIRYAPSEAAQSPEPRDDDADAPDPFWDALARRTNHGITDLRVLDGNIRYMNYAGFVWAGGDGRASAAALDTAMAFLRGGDAIIIDLRTNGGGDPRAVRHLVSYFVPADTPLMTFRLRSDPPAVSRAAADVAGGRIAGTPVYVLTSSRTYSAAEEFTSHVQRLKFGTLVGETTGGGAYRNALYPVASRYILSVSIGRSDVPGGGNWEGRGIAPTIAVPREAALDAAQADALRMMARGAGDAAALTLMKRLADYHAARAAPLTPARAPAAYAGRYGERDVTLDGSRLTIRRGDGPVSDLVSLGGDRFALSGDPSTQVTFAGTTGGVMTLALDRVDGRRESAARAQ